MTARSTLTATEIGQLLCEEVLTGVLAPGRGSQVYSKNGVAVVGQLPNRNVAAPWIALLAGTALCDQIGTRVQELAERGLIPERFQEKGLAEHKHSG